MTRHSCPFRCKRLLKKCSSSGLQPNALYLVRTELKSAENRKHLLDAEVIETNAEKSRLSDELTSLNALKADADQSVAIHKQMAPYASVEELWDAIKRLQE